MTIKRALEDVPVDPAAEERAWAVVRTAYAQRVPVARRSRRWPVVAVVVAVAAAAAVLSPPGRAVVDAVRRSIGVSHAAPALFRLPAPGRLLVSGPGGAWVVSADGSKRRLGSWTEAAWSPHGLFVVGAHGDELAALEPAGGAERWTLGRPDVASPRWGGTRTDTRIAYLSGGRLRVVAGDGTGDREIGPARAVAPVWRPESHVVAYRARAGVAVVDVDTRRVLARHAARGVRALAWSPDGRTLAAADARVVHLWRTGAPQLELRIPGVRALAFAADGRLALLRSREIVVVSGGEAQTAFEWRTPLAGLAWSPDGSWLATAIPAADQLVFVGRRGVRAVGNAARQFGGAVSLDGWVGAP
ncbi:MAG TPA: hypothetical protein VFA56_01275 [Gaiellaceae bacterium]|nr:hypothetical protein [Gaiellaceae bacterium]